MFIEVGEDLTIVRIPGFGTNKCDMSLDTAVVQGKQVCMVGMLGESLRKTVY